MKEKCENWNDVEMQFLFFYYFSFSLVYFFDEMSAIRSIKKELLIVCII